MKTSDATTCIVLAGLLEWTGPAGLIEWREEQVKATEGDSDLVVLEFALGPRAARANEESTEDAEGEEADAMEQVEATEGDGDLVILEFVLGPQAARANKESAEVLVVDGASEGLEATGDSDVVEVIRAVEGLEVTEAVEAVAAERQVQPKVCGNQN